MKTKKIGGLPTVAACLVPAEPEKVCECFYGGELCDMCKPAEPEKVEVCSCGSKIRSSKCACETIDQLKQELEAIRVELADYMKWYIEYKAKADALAELAYMHIDPAQCTDREMEIYRPILDELHQQGKR